MRWEAPAVEEEVKLLVVLVVWRISNWTSHNCACVCVHACV